MAHDFIGARQFPHVEHFPEAASAESRRYAETVNRMARAFIYDKRKVAELQVGLKSALSDPALRAFEDKSKKFEAVLQFCRGVEAHEKANLVHDAPWQAALVHQPAAGKGNVKAPEKLTREDVAKEFAAFDLKDTLLESETQAMKAYQAFLASGAEAEIPLSSNITLKRSDITVLINDLEVRRAERLADPEERRAKLLELNRQLLEVIRDLPREEVGKRFELEEIYLLRRLIQTADTGHIVSVAHGTPRQDLNINEGSVDLTLTFGARVDLQVKTYQGRVSSATLAQQTDELAYRRATLEGTTTKLVVLRAEEVKDVFEATGRRREDEPTSLNDKKTVFEPILQSLDAAQSKRLVTLLGLTEERCRAERELFLKREAEFNEFSAQARARRAAEERLIEERAAQLAAQSKAERLATELREREEREARERRAAEARQRDIEAAQAVREAIEAAKRNKLVELEAQTEARRVADLAAKEEARKSAERAAKKEARPDWPPTPGVLEKMLKAPLLKRLGFLPADQKEDFTSIKAAKELFLKVFPDPKTGFAKVFLDEESLSSPDEGTLTRLRAAREKKKL